MAIVKNKYIIDRRIHGSFFLIDSSDNYMGDKCALYEINETGMFLWNHIDGQRSSLDLAKLLREAIIDEVDFDLIKEDVENFVQNLVSHKFVEVK